MGNVFSLKKTSRGFTLVELLVVIAIVSVLSSVVLANLNQARAKARDAARMHTLTQIRNALQLYWEDHNQSYPDVYASGKGSVWGPWSNLQNALAPYMKVPDEVNDSGANVWYPYLDDAPAGHSQYSYYSFDGSDYDLVTVLETSHIADCSNKKWRVHVPVPAFGLPTTNPWCEQKGYLDNLFSDHP